MAISSLLFICFRVNCREWGVWVQGHLIAPHFGTFWRRDPQRDCKRGLPMVSCPAIINHPNHLGPICVTEKSTR